MIELIILTVLFTRGLFYSASEGYIFEGLKRSLAKLLGLHEEYDTTSSQYLYFDASSKSETWRDYLWKPFWGCIHCMNSVWGILLCVVLGVSFLSAIIIIACAVGLSFLISNFTK